MKLQAETVPERFFPPLAWVAQYDPENRDSLKLRCGELVERGTDYAVEGVWPGSFEDKGFDTSELFYGSGFRIIGSTARFISSCSTVDRIWSHTDKGLITISNSLPCLLRIADIELVRDNNNYAKIVETIVKGRGYQKHFPVGIGQLQVHYFENIELFEGTLVVVPKSEHVNSFPDFESYSEFMFETADRIGQNARDPTRNYPVDVFSTISKGYDSPVASVLAKRAGALTTFTITSARSVFPRGDSGAQIAKSINLQCEEYTSSQKKIQDEQWYWAANGSLQDMNLSIFNYPSGPSVMFTGFNGDMVWSRSPVPSGADYLKRKDSTGLGFCEHRLLKGVIHCPVPFWGIRHLADVKRISEDDEMRSWSVGGEYDRPVPRRIAEEAGISRELFGQTKSATTVDELLLLPLSSDLTTQYQNYLKLGGERLPRLLSVPFAKILVDIYRAVFRQRLIDLSFKLTGRSKRKKTFSWEDQLFQWSNSALKKRILN